MPWRVCLLGVLLASLVGRATAAALRAELDRSALFDSYGGRRHRGDVIRLAWPPEMRLFEKAPT